MPRSRLVLPSLLLLVTTLTVACSDDVEVDSGSLKDGFAAGAEKAYADDGSSRADDFQRGVTTTCFALDDDGIGRISDALGLDESAELDDSAYLYGAPSKEMLSCSYRSADEEEAPPIAILVSRTEDDLDEHVERLLDLEDGPEELEGESDGLDDDSVTGFARGGFQQAVWLEDGLLIGVGGREEDVDADELFEALPVVVDQVGRVLTSD